MLDISVYTEGESWARFTYNYYYLEKVSISMNKIALQGVGRSILLVGLSVLCAVAFVSLVARASTTISTDITTGGALSVTGASTLTGAATLSSTMSVASLATLTSGFISVASSTAVGTFGVSGATTLASTTATGFKVGQTGTISSNIIAGYCVATVTFATLNIASSTQTYVNCTPYTAGGTAITTLTAVTSRVFVQATSSLPFHVLVQSASTTASNIINISLLNTSTSTLPSAGSIYSFNFWSFQ